ncbi:hypothetical protein ACFSC3_18750 [Sphingomonas floccifaciens]|uniref:Uncharacterized protein n=1 Tax=Sphingomonas floccifaciens TaxID=1844115 RepID=A0ABW4NIB7_9SPHN
MTTHKMIPEFYDLGRDPSRSESLDRIDAQLDRLKCLIGRKSELRIKDGNQILLEFAKSPDPLTGHRWLEVQFDDEGDGVTMEMMGSSLHREFIVPTSLSLCLPDPVPDLDDPRAKAIAVAAAIHDAAKMHVAHLRTAQLEPASVDDGELPPYCESDAAAAFLEDWWGLPPGTPIQADFACPCGRQAAFWSVDLDRTFDRVRNDAALPTVMIFDTKALEIKGWYTDQLVMSQASISLEVPDAIEMMRQAASPAVERLRAAHQDRP